MALLVATADNHLGRYSARMPFARLEERRGILRRGFYRAVDYALRHQAAAFLHAGDLFDTVDPRNAERVAVAQRLARLREAGIAVVATGGNHDTPRHSGQQGGFHAADIYASLGTMHFCADPVVVSSIIVQQDGLRLQIGGISWNPTLTPDDDPIKDLEFPDPDDGRADWKILLAHASLEGHMFPGAEEREPVVQRQTVATLDLDVLILGHVHARTYEQIAGRHVLVPGATERMVYGEFGHEPGFAVIELGPNGAWDHSWEHFPAQPRRRVTVTGNELIAAPQGLRDPDESITETVIRRVQEASDPRQLTTLILEGDLPQALHAELDLAQVQDVGMANNFFFDIRTDQFHLADEFGDPSADTVRLSQKDEIEMALAELRQTTTTEEQRAALSRSRQRILAYYTQSEDGG